jgi:tungstate transport system substrate-binding protein
LNRRSPTPQPPPHRGGEGGRSTSLPLNTAVGRGLGGGASLGTLLLLCLTLTLPPAARADTPHLILGTTIGLQQTGLLDRLVPLFEQQTGRQVTVVALSAPQALAQGARGEVDVLLIDADEDEALFVAAGHGVDRRLVLHADDVVLGPRSDPAGIRAAAGMQDVLRRIAGSQSTWVSRADNSGLYQIEKRLWREAGVEPIGQPWYVQIGQGMLQTLTASTERQGYTLADRLTFLERRDSLDLAILTERQPDLLRLFHVITINPTKGPWIEADGARALADFLLGADAQAIIRDFAVDRFGEPIFVPDAGRTEQELRPARQTAP